MERLDVDSNFGQIAETIENHYAGPPSLPPEGHPNSRVCPQCQATTWRMTQHCLCCGLDLFRLDHEERQRRAALRRLKVAGFFAMLSALAMYSQSHVADGVVRLWLMVAAVASMLVAAAALKE